MVEYVKTQILLQYIIRSSPTGDIPMGRWTTAYHVARDANNAAFENLLRLAFPLAYRER